MPRVRDRAAQDAGYFSAEQLGDKMHLTPEGFLLCLDVPIARIGNQLYRAGEVPVDANSGGEVVVERNAEEVFRPETLASFNGKSVVNDHPEVDDPEEEGWDVNPDNWKELTIGVTLNPRRGEGANSDKVLADLLITDKDAIEAVQSGKREVSCGYDAQYETLAPGHGRQRNILGNHVALVDMARCGPSCSIGDSTMAKTTGTKSRWDAFRDALLGSVTRGDAKAAERHIASFQDELVGSEPGAGDNHVHVHLGGKDEKEEKDPLTALTERFDGFEKKFGDFMATMGKKGKDESGKEEEDEEKKTGDETELMDDPEPSATGDEDEEEEDKKKSKDGKKKSRDGVRVRDSAHIEGNFQDMLSRAEMLVPGISVPTFDSRQPATRTIDAMCQFRRRALLKAWATDDGREILETVLGTTRDDIRPLVQKMTCDAVLTAFNGSAEMARRANNTHTQVQRRATGDQKKGPQTLGEVNAANRKFYKQGPDAR